MKHKPTLLLSTAILIFTSGCGSDQTNQNTATPTIYLITATLPATSTPRPTDTPLATSQPTAPAPVEGTTTSQLNVRTEPSASSEILGMVGIFTKVQIIGKDPSGSWYQIIYSVGESTAPPPAGNNGIGWITSGFVQVAPDAEIAVIGTVPPATPLTNEPDEIPESQETFGLPTLSAPIVMPAPQDGDSVQSPAVSITFSPASAQAFNYTSDISSPEGDADDWVQFTPFEQTGVPVSVSIMIDCIGNSTLGLELWQNEAELQSWDGISCGQRSRLLLNLFGGAPYSIRLLIGSNMELLNYIYYTLIVQMGG